MGGEEISRLLEDMNRTWQEYDQILKHPGRYPQPQEAIALIETSTAFTDACWQLEALGVHWYSLDYDKASKTFSLPAALTASEAGGRI